MVLMHLSRLVWDTSLLVPHAPETPKCSCYSKYQTSVPLLMLFSLPGISSSHTVPPSPQIHTHVRSHILCLGYDLRPRSGETTCHKTCCPLLSSTPHFSWPLHCQPLSVYSSHCEEAHQEKGPQVSIYCNWAPGQHRARNRQRYSLLRIVMMIRLTSVGPWQVPDTVLQASHALLFSPHWTLSCRNWYYTTVQIRKPGLAEVNNPRTSG